MNRNEVLKKMDECERKELFHEHVIPPNYDKMLPVSSDYDYIKKGFGNKVGSFFSVGLFKFASTVISPCFKLKIIGKENIKGINSGAIITVNHINMFDSVLVKKAFKNKKLKITVAEFNNYHGLFGKILRGAGTMPFSSSIDAMKHLSQGISYYLQKNNFILFYPEAALWWCYEKPRPLLNGAYFYATKNNVPIIPTFFTFKNLKKRKDGTYKKQFILHIGKAIYPKKDVSNKENIEYLKQANFEWNKQVYEDFYNKKLEYLK